LRISRPCLAAKAIASEAAAIWHAGQQLVDHLERRALARGIAEFVKLCRHCVQCRPCLGEGRRTAGSKNGQFALRGALRAAGDRRVQIVPAGGFELFRQPPRDVGVHGR